MGRPYQLDKNPISKVIAMDTQTDWQTVDNTARNPQTYVATNQTI